MIHRVLLAGGGTGGHLFPGVAVTEELRRRLPDLDVLFVGTDRGIEARVLPKLNERFEVLDVKPLLGRRKLELLKNLTTLPGSSARALSLLRRYKPDLVIGLGGYVAGPVLLSAAACGIPTALLEQNAHVGFTNRLLARVVGRAYLTYPETAGRFRRRTARVLGNPVRRAFVEAARLSQHDPIGVFARSRRLLVLGGSQGARALNRVAPEAFAQAGIAARGIGVLHQTGAEMVDEVARSYTELGISADVRPFIDDMARAYASALLTVARAGATTLAELCAMGRASILVPYPYAAQDHQTKNAEALARAGAAIALPESELSASALATQVAALLDDNERRQAMADAALRLGRPDAAAAIVDDLFDWLRVPNTGAVASEQSAEGGSSTPSDPDPTLGRGRRRPRPKRCELRVRPIEGEAVAGGAWEVQRVARPQPGHGGP